IPSAKKTHPKGTVSQERRRYTEASHPYRRCCSRHGPRACAGQRGKTRSDSVSSTATTQAGIGAAGRTGGPVMARRARWGGGQSVRDPQRGWRTSGGDTNGAEWGG
ncbi:unnamed protein product, partial [Ectocarpus sp. 12 AP-2014]